jgi:hypothetical protein
MEHWKLLLSRLMFSTIWVVIITGLGAFLGAIVGVIVDLMLQALLGMPVPDAMVPAIMLAGSGWAFLWAMRVAIVHRSVKVPSRV